ncbi:hypothetical protein AYI68_g1770 [Smittium mucronatum]|uniref:Uncharacterized protein n=1 Tax=Smittium mucronatum TaxID=133383 RepID=A0A1R0H4J9_9FUNG|nr:hypothetical protein AYI68_g1770 [Smittium mucronatum]
MVVTLRKRTVSKNVKKSPAIKKSTRGIVNEKTAQNTSPSKNKSSKKPQEKSKTTKKTANTKNNSKISENRKESLTSVKDALIIKPLKPKRTRKSERKSEMFLFVDDSSFSGILNSSSENEDGDFFDKSGRNSKSDKNSPSNKRTLATISTSETGELSQEKLDEFEKGLIDKSSSIGSYNNMGSESFLADFEENEARKIKSPKNKRMQKSPAKNPRNSKASPSNLIESTSSSSIDFFTTNIKPSSSEPIAKINWLDDKNVGNSLPISAKSRASKNNANKSQTEKVGKSSRGAKKESSSPKSKSKSTDSSIPNNASTVKKEPKLLTLTTTFDFGQTKKSAKTNRSNIDDFELVEENCVFIY